MRGWFVTGSDTGVGKTTVSLALLAHAAARGLRTAAMKPAESGCATGPDGSLVPADAMALAGACTLELALELVCPYRYAAAIAPGVAADRLGERIDLGTIARCFAALRARDPDVLLVEGAGGLLVPIGQRRTMRDLAAELGLPLLVVGRDSLGTINHTALTVEAARHAGLAVEAIILSATAPDTAPMEARSNAAEIEAATGVPVLGILPRLTQFHPAHLAAVAAAQLRLEVLRFT